MSRFLLINPPIYDFAAYDLWAKPFGLLQISALLKQGGHEVGLVDCLDRHHPLMPKPVSDEWGCGPYLNKEVQKPDVLSDIPRKYKRYGLPEGTIAEILKSLDDPDFVLVSSGMTYWYPGVFEVIRAVKSEFRDSPVILGGNYATLCSGHARKLSGADFVVKGGGPALYDILCGLGLRIEELRVPFEDYPAPDYEGYANLSYAATRTSIGCPFNCSYCASSALTGGPWQAKPLKKMIREFEGYAAKGIKKVALYDDALLFKAESHIAPILKEALAKGLAFNFHTPNGLHARFITREVAGLLKDSGFVMPRLSLETISPKAQKETGGKVLTKDYLSAVANLVDSGFRKGEFVAYTMIGMPGQALEEVDETLDLAHGSGARISLGEFSPIPETPDWERIKSRIPSQDPLWQNNSIFPLHPLSDWPKLRVLKDKAHRLNGKLRVMSS